MTFREWRAQLHILEAIARLSQGDRVTDVAYDLGFSNPSSFIALFSKALNVTPGNYLKSLDKKPEQNRVSALLQGSCQTNENSHRIAGTA